ncbi:winged helix-turn-helix domain-containing protein [Dokdonella sp.]|uniref:winged helix-turn-helix domain-containing protein n=1 Tax=Dokdonella sp. TaxID=2291710 RepID=UPI001B17BC4C|nr:winged helix-turn-helix domain-containing protein [Dokdonella sp.]MBO9663169.1 winged helix-turn-helix domain-containing protein [Dokdonella sp.]
MAHIHRFGEFRLDAATRELRRGGVPVPVPPRAFDCIVYLVEHRDRAVGRDELIAAVWGKADITDGMLGQTVLSARRVLDDTGKEQQYIRTVFRFGYHWVAPTEWVDEAAERAVETAEPAKATSEPAAAGAAAESKIEASPPPREQRRRWRLPVVAALGVLALLALLWGGNHLLRRSALPASTAAAQNGGRVVLVLPVATSAGPGYDWVRLGVMDLIAARLRAAGVPVVPSDNVVALTGSKIDNQRPQDFAALAHTAGASLVIDAQAQENAGRWRVSLRTVHGESTPLRADGEAADVLGAARIAADRMAQQLGYAPAADRSSGGDANALANLLPQVDAAILSERLDAARTLLESVPAAQRENPEVRMRLAHIDHQAGQLDAAEAGYKAIAAAVSPERDAVLHARALSNLGVIAAQRDDNELAQQRFDAAIALLRREQAPDALGKALNGRAAYYSAIHRPDAALADLSEARVAFESAGNLLALAVLDSNLGALDMLRGRYAEAQAAFTRAADRFATFGAHAMELNALTAVAELKLAQLEPDQALALEARLRQLIGQVSDPARQRNGELTRLQVLAANGRLRTLDADLERVLDAARREDDRVAVARASTLAAELALARSDAPRAAEYAGAAAQRFTSIADDPHERLRVGLLQVRARLAAGQDSKDALAALTSFAEHDGSASARFHADLARAEVDAAAGDDGGAGKAYAQALAEADATRIPLDLREAARAYAGWLIGKDDLAQAGAVAERVAVWAARDYESALLQLRVYHALGQPNLWRIALARARALNGDREIPAALQIEPKPR